MSIKLQRFNPTAPNKHETAAAPRAGGHSNLLGRVNAAPPNSNTH